MRNRKEQRKHDAAGKDPELWERMRRMPIYVHRDSSLTVDLTKSDNTELVDAWLQHCLQEAIRARGWGLQQDYIPWFHETHRCRAYISIGTQNGDLFEGIADTEAEALLRAYLAAIQEAA